MKLVRSAYAETHSTIRCRGWPSTLWSGILLAGLPGAAFCGAALLATGASAISPKLTKVTVSHSSHAHRPVVPTITLIHSGGRWRVMNKPFQMALRIYVQVNTGSHIDFVHVVAPAPGPHPKAKWVAWDRRTFEGNKTRKLLIRNTRHSYSAVHLGYLLPHAIRACQTQLPSGSGERRINRRMTVLVQVGVARTLQVGVPIRSASRKVGYRIFCRRPFGGTRAGPSAPQRSRD